MIGYLSCIKPTIVWSPESTKMKRMSRRGSFPTQKPSKVKNTRPIANWKLPPILILTTSRWPNSSVRFHLYISLGLSIKVALKPITQEDFPSAQGTEVAAPACLGAPQTPPPSRVPGKLFSQTSLGRRAQLPQQNYSITFEWPLPLPWKWRVSGIGQTLATFTGTPWKARLMNSIWTLFP